MKKPIIELVDVVKSYGEHLVLDKLSFAIRNGEFVTLLGPSGSGKTTILRLIGGFEDPTRGEIKFEGRDVKDLPPHKRFTRTIFQNYALFPNLNVESNIHYGLKLKRIPLENISKEIKKKNAQQLKTWKKIASSKMRKLDKEQEKYEKIMNKNKAKSKSYRKAQKWHDDSDFHYSYWENYANMKQQSFDKKYTTRKINKQEIERITSDVIKKVHLEGYEKYNVDSLSGGMQQRVALARAIVADPKVLLLDEPLSALDAKVRKKTQSELKRIHRDLGITFILITHNQEEALELSDRVAVIRDGKIEQFDKPKQIYHHPINAWVANFVGTSNIFVGKILSLDKVKIKNLEIKINKSEFKIGEKVDILLRPEQINIVSKEKGIISGEVTETVYKGSYIEAKVQTNIFKKPISLTSTKNVKTGSKVNLSWNIEDLHLMKKIELAKFMEGHDE